MDRFYEPILPGIFLLEPSNRQIMRKESLEKLSFAELCNLLVENTLLLLEAIDKKADEVSLRDQKKQVELIQEMIRKKRAGR